MRLNVGIVGTLSAAFAGAAMPAMGQGYFESFEGGTNNAAWSFNAPIQGPTMPGGYVSPWYYRAEGLDTTIPFLRCAVGAPGVTGSYRVPYIDIIQFALRVDATDFPVADLHPAVIFVSQNATPTDPSDDWGAYILSGTTLGPSGHWRRHAVHVQPYVQTLPLGWNFISFGPNSPANPSWPALVSAVNRLEISFGDPSLFYTFQVWTVSADAIGLTSCYANCDGSFAVPFRNVNDFICFMNRFSAGDSYANCDSSTTLPVLNVNDYVCFNEVFAAGCSSP